MYSSFWHIIFFLHFLGTNSNLGYLHTSHLSSEGRAFHTRLKFASSIKSWTKYYVCSLAVLEGIAIGFNPDYKVLGSTYPWIARKVLTDSSPQLKSSLMNLLYKVNIGGPGFGIFTSEYNLDSCSYLSFLSTFCLLSHNYVATLFKCFSLNFDDIPLC